MHTVCGKRADRFNQRRIRTQSELFPFGRFYVGKRVRSVARPLRNATANNNQKSIRSHYMKLFRLIAGVLLAGSMSIAAADLEPWTDYDLSEGVSNVTTVKVDSNRIDTYLEGLSKTWAPSNEVAMELGQIESYAIYVSELPNGGDFNVVLVVRMKDASALQPTKERYEAFMKAWGEENQAMNDKIVPTYPGIRTIVGEYLLREVTLK